MGEIEMRVKTSLILILILFLSQATYVSAFRGRLLVVCSDAQDVMFANSLGLKGFDVDILYLGKDLPGDRSKLSSLAYLVKYDEIWIPDLNVKWTDGGRLTKKETKVLSEYVNRGGVLVIGLNTYAQSWSRSLEEITGTRLLRIETPKTDSEEWDIVYEGKEYAYNGTYQTVVVNVYRGEVIARYKNGLPAITVSKFGNGVGVLLTFNPVKELVEYNPDIIELYPEIGLKALDERSSPPNLSRGALFALQIKELLTNPLFISLLLLVVLEILGYLGLISLGITILLAVPFLPFSKLLLKSHKYKKIIETVTTFRGITLTELSQETGITKRRLKFPIACLILNHRIAHVNLRSLGESETLIVLKGLEGEGVASWAVRRYPRLMEIIANTPGITIIDLAHRINMPPYDVLRLMRELSKYGVVEVRKMVVDYEVYPMKPLLRWFEL